MYVIIYMSIHDKNDRQELSRLRQRLRRLIDRLERALEASYDRSPMIKGTVYELARKCGTPGCRCARGELHRSMALSWSEEGKTRLKSLKPEQVEDVRRKSKVYARFRRSRAQVTKIYREMLEVLDRIEELRREEYSDG